MKNKKINTINWDLLSNILNGTESETQKQVFKQWLSSDDTNLKYFEQIKSVWIKTGSISHLYSEETNNAWEELKLQTINKKKTALSISRRLLIPISIAASLLVLFFIGKELINTEKITIYSKEAILEYKLPDNSSVDLKTTSSMYYTKRFGTKKREVWLTGEAFFDVQKIKNKPFIIHTKYAKFKVIGTSFNISSYENSDILSLIVKTGVVELFLNERKGSIKATKGTQIQYNTKTKKIIKKQIITNNYIAWKTGILEFKDTKLQDVAITLENTYNTKIRFETESIKELTFTASFKNQSLDKIIKVIALTFDLEVENEDGKTTFKQRKTAPNQ